MSDEIRFNHAAPTFLVSDVGGTTEWYRKEMGFYEVLKDRPFIRMHLTKQSYGDSEFEVIDPNGYILVFSELISK